MVQYNYMTTCAMVHICFQVSLTLCEISKYAQQKSLYSIYSLQISSGFWSKNNIFFTINWFHKQNLTLQGPTRSLWHSNQGKKKSNGQTWYLRTTNLILPHDFSQSLVLFWDFRKHSLILWKRSCSAWHHLSHDSFLTSVSILYTLLESHISGQWWVLPGCMPVHA